MILFFPRMIHFLHVIFFHDSWILHVIFFKWFIFTIHLFSHMTQFPSPMIQLFSCDFSNDSFPPKQFIFVTCDLFPMLHLYHLIFVTYLLIFTSFLLQFITIFTWCHMLTWVCICKFRAGNVIAWNICDFSRRKVWRNEGSVKRSPGLTSIIGERLWSLTSDDSLASDRLQMVPVMLVFDWLLIGFVL